MPKNIKKIISFSFIASTSILFPVINSAACGSSYFPKIIGGTGGYAYIAQIDVYSDDLAVAGYSCDQPLLTSISAGC